MITSVSDTMTLSWLISCGVCQQLRESHEREPFFRSMFFCFSLLGCSWSERFVVFSERPLLFFSVADRDRQGRRRLRFWMRSWGVWRSLVVMTLHFGIQGCDYFFFFISLFFVLFMKKWRLWPGRSTPSPTRGQRSSFAERTMKFPILIFQLQLVLVPAVPPVMITVFWGRCTRQFSVVPFFPKYKKKNINDKSGIEEQYSQLRKRSGRFSSAGRRSWEHCGTPMRSLRIARALVVVVMPLAGDDTRFFLKKVGKHLMTFFNNCAQTTCFSDPKLTHEHNRWLSFTLLRFWSLFPRFLTLKNVKNGISRTVNYILSFEFPKTKNVPFERTRKMMRIYGGNFQSAVSKCMNHSSQKLAKLHVL